MCLLPHRHSLAVLVLLDSNVCEYLSVARTAFRATGLQSGLVLLSRRSGQEAGVAMATSPAVATERPPAGRSHVEMPP